MPYLSSSGVPRFEDHEEGSDAKLYRYSWHIIIAISMISITFQFWHTVLAPLSQYFHLIVRLLLGIWITGCALRMFK